MLMCTVEFACPSDICSGTIVKVKTGRQHEEKQLPHSYRLSEAHKVIDKM